MRRVAPCLAFGLALAMVPRPAARACEIGVIRFYSGTVFARVSGRRVDAETRWERADVRRVLRRAFHRYSRARADVRFCYHDYVAREHTNSDSHDAATVLHVGFDGDRSPRLSVTVDAPLGRWTDADTRCMQDAISGATDRLRAGVKARFTVVLWWQSSTRVSLRAM